MRCPVHKEVSCQTHKGVNIYRIIDAAGGTVATSLTEKNADYIVQAINSHKKLVKELKEARQLLHDTILKESLLNNTIIGKAMN